MTTAWAHLPNAAHIDRVLASLAATPKAWTAAWDAARDAAWDAAWGAAGNAAWDAALFGRMLVCVGLSVDAKHLMHVNERMRVWRKGYGLYCDVNGTLYVYKKVS